MNDFQILLAFCVIQGFLNAGLCLWVAILVCRNYRLKSELFAREKWHERELAKRRRGGPYAG